MKKKQFNNVYVRRFGYFNLYVIRGKNGDILIDTGFICMKHKIKKWLDQFNIKLIILTHAHVDHIWNAAYLKKIYNCEIALGIDDIKNIDNSLIHSQPVKQRYNWWCKLMNYGMNHLKAKNFDIDIKLKDNQVIRRYDLELRIVSLPGHTNGSIGVIYETYLFVGDALVNRWNGIEIAYQNQDCEQALLSFEKIKGLNPEMIFFGHDKESKKNTI